MKNKLHGKEKAWLLWVDPNFFGSEFTEKRFDPHFNNYGTVWSSSKPTGEVEATLKNS